jgi:hypothetical protein
VRRPPREPWPTPREPLPALTVADATGTVQVRPEQGAVPTHHAEIPALSHAQLREALPVEVEAVLVFPENEPGEGLLDKGHPGHAQPRGGTQVGLLDHAEFTQREIPNRGSS